MYETHRQPPVTARTFAHRLLRHAGGVAALLGLSLALGMAGYMGLEHLGTVDAFLNAAMLLGGMGPVNPPQTTGGKLFAGIYALYAGLVFIVSAALLFTPVLHRVIHRLHWDDDAR